MTIIPERHLADARSKNPIVLYDTDDLKYIDEKTKHHTMEDRFDCLCVFEAKTIEALREYGESSDELSRMRRMYVFHYARLGESGVIQQMASLALVTSVDRCTHGKSLLKHFFRK